MDALAESPVTCTARQAQQASREIAHVKEWEALYGSFKSAGSCDRGRVSQEYSYAISHLLAHHWGEVGALLKLAAADEGFKQFILRHINEDMPEEESQVILSQSRQQCPADGEWLCKAIADY